MLLNFAKTQPRDVQTLSMAQKYDIPDSLSLELNYHTGALLLSPDSMPSSAVRKAAASSLALATENNPSNALPSFSSVRSRPKGLVVGGEAVPVQ
jgi:hypothetical protein